MLLKTKILKSKINILVSLNEIAYVIKKSKSSHKIFVKNYEMQKWLIIKIIKNY